MTDADTVVVTYTFPPPPAPRGPPGVTAAPHSNDSRDLTCAGCANVMVSYTTPAYVSRDAAQALTLTYNRGRAVPRAYVQVEASLNTSSAPDWLALALKRGTIFEPLTNGGTEARFGGATGLSRLAAQIDVGGLGTGTYDDTAYVSATWTSGTSETYTTKAPVRFLVLNGQSDTVYGAGWAIAGLQRLYFASGNATTTSITLVDGSGAAAYFANCGQFSGQGPTYGDQRGTVVFRMNMLIASRDSLFWVNPDGGAYGCAR